MDAESSLAVLEEMNVELANVDAQKIEESKIPSPIAEVEKSLSEFSQDVFSLVRDEFNFQKALEIEILNRLSLDEKDGGITNNQLLLLHNNSTVALNDRISKALGPTFQLMTAKQQAEIAAKTAESRAAVQIAVNNGGVNETFKKLNASENTSQEILQGLNTLQNLFNAALETGKQASTS